LEGWEGGLGGGWSAWEEKRERGGGMTKVTTRWRE